MSQIDRERREKIQMIEDALDIRLPDTQWARFFDILKSFRLINVDWVLQEIYRVASREYLEESRYQFFCDLFAALFQTQEFTLLQDYLEHEGSDHLDVFGYSDNDEPFRGIRLMATPSYCYYISFEQRSSDSLTTYPYIILFSPQGFEQNEYEMIMDYDNNGDIEFLPPEEVLFMDTILSGSLLNLIGFLNDMLRRDEKERLPDDIFEIVTDLRNLMITIQEVFYPRH